MQGLRESLQLALNNHNKPKERKALHSVICENLSCNDTMSLFPSIDKNEYYRSRYHGLTVGVGVTADIAQRRHQFNDIEKVFVFVQFMLSPEICTTLPWGQTTMTYSNGEVVQLPKAKRSLNRTAIIARYNDYILSFAFDIFLFSFCLRKMNFFVRLYVLERM